MKPMNLRLIALIATAVLNSCATTTQTGVENPYANYVWPPAPDKARIQLVDILYGRANVEGESKLAKALIGVDPTGQFDRLKKPFAVEIDRQGRILVTDTEMAALVRFDRQKGQYDVFGKTEAITLAQPMGMDLANDGTIYVADASLKKIIAFSPEGDVVAVYGSKGELSNPTDVAVDPSGTRLFTADSKAHRIVVFDISTGAMAGAFGVRGEGPGQFAFPTSLVFGPEGNLWVVDQLNTRVQILADDGEFLDEFGELVAGFGGFVRPKDIAISDGGLVFVTDAAFNNAQLFDIDLQLLTFIGSFGQRPGQFRNIIGIAIQGDEFAMVDQLNHRVQLFRFIETLTGG